MAKQTINLGTQPNGADGDTSRTAFEKARANFDELYGQLQPLNAALAAEVGKVSYFPARTAPAGYLKCNGGAVPRKTYAALFAVIGTSFGAGDGATTFNLPDLRGEFVRGWDDGRGVDGGRALGSFQADGIREHAHYPGSSVTRFGGQYQTAGGGTFGFGYEGQLGGMVGPASETRPRNVALLACIKY